MVVEACMSLGTVPHCVAFCCVYCGLFVCLSPLYGWRCICHHFAQQIHKNTRLCNIRRYDNQTKFVVANENVIISGTAQCWRVVRTVATINDGRRAFSRMYWPMYATCVQLENRPTCILNRMEIEPQAKFIFSPTNKT